MSGSNQLHKLIRNKVKAEDKKVHVRQENVICII